MSRSGSGLKSTFPISSGEMRLRVVRSVLLSPISWLPYLAVLNLWLNDTVGSTIAAVSVLAITSALIFYWGISLEKLRKRAMRRLIRDSNQKQDKELFRRAGELAERGFNECSLKLVNFVYLKHKIEAAIHEGGGKTSRREEIDNLVDSIAFGAADQLEKMAEIGERLKKKRSKPLPPDVEEHYRSTLRNIASQLDEASEMLTETWENLGEWFDEAELPDSEHPGMEAAIEHLKTERDLVYRVRDRMNSDWISEFPEPEGERELETE